MNDSPSGSGRKLIRLPKEQRDRWVAKFHRSGLSAKDFAQKNGLSYAALCRWKKSHQAQDFIEVECPAPPRPMEIGLGSEIRVRIYQHDQVSWVSDLIRQLRRGRSC